MTLKHPGKIRVHYEGHYRYVNKKLAITAANLSAVGVPSKEIRATMSRVFGSNGLNAKDIQAVRKRYQVDSQAHTIHGKKNVTLTPQERYRHTISDYGRRRREVLKRERGLRREITLQSLNERYMIGYANRAAVPISKYDRSYLATSDYFTEKSGDYTIEGS